MWSLPLLALLLQTAGCQARRLHEEGNVGSAIVYGDEATPGRHPYMVSIRTSDAWGTSHRCGGSLIHPRVVLTAAHCVLNSETGLPRPPELFLPLVRVGGFYRTKDQPADYDLRKVVRTVAHPAFRCCYQQDYMTNDVALLLLDEPSTKMPVQLAPYAAKPALPLPAYSDAWALGWGWTTPLVGSTNMLAEGLREARLKLLPLSECQRRWGTITYTSSSGARRPVSLDWFNNTALCNVDALNPISPYAGTCAGDSGGPHISKGVNASSDVQIGIESFGPRPCGTWVGGMASVAQHRRWIDAGVSLLTASAWQGSVSGGQRILGFYGGIKSTGTLAPGKTMTVLAIGNATNGTRLTTRLAAGLPGQQAVSKTVSFKAGAGAAAAEVFIAIVPNNALNVTVGGLRMMPGRTWNITGGTVDYRTPPRLARAVVITQPGLTVTVRQPVLGGTRAQWLDVAVRLTRAPSSPSGVLGATFPSFKAA